jgi:gliding motility-associated-like protein
MLNAQDVQLINTGRNYQYSKWYFGDGDSSVERNPMHTYSFNTQFLATQILSNGFCTDTFSREVFVNFQSYNQIPTAFSPDQNDMNDGFKVFNASGTATFAIFNSWGEMLYNTADNSAWDGSYKGMPCPQGVYLYVADVKDVSGDAKQFRGSVTLLR